MPRVKDLVVLKIPPIQAKHLGVDTALSLTATGNNSQGSGYAISANYNQFSTVTAANNSAVLPAVTDSANGFYIVTNADAADNLNVFPSSGDNFIGLSANTAVVVEPGVSLLAFRAGDSDSDSQWFYSLVSSGAGLVTSVSNTDGTLTISPTTGDVIASINLFNDNHWSGEQWFYRTRYENTYFLTDENSYLYYPMGAVLATPLGDLHGGDGVVRIAGNGDLNFALFAGNGTFVDLLGNGYFANGNPFFTAAGEIYGDGANITNVNHSLLTNLAADDHPNYVYYPGRIGGQTIYGGNQANEDLHIIGTSHSTRTTSAVMIQSLGGDVGIGFNSTPSAQLHVIKTTEQLRLGYDTSNYFSATVASAGQVTLNATGASAAFTFSDDVSVPDEAYGAGWNGSLEVPTKNAVYDKIETISGGSGLSQQQTMAIGSLQI